jgi:hypothetical protein
MLLVSRFFSSFPAGQPGVGLLLLRAVLAFRLATEGITLWNTCGYTALFVLALLLCALLVMVGFLTPFVPIAVCLIVLGAVSYRMVVVNDATAIDHWETRVFELATALSLALIGPGSYSIDAFLFGRHEIVFGRRTSR